MLEYPCLTLVLWALKYVVVQGLLDLKNKFPKRLNILQLDLTIESSIKACTMSVREKYGSLNRLINASGILSIPNMLQPETTLNRVEKSSLMLAYEVNAVGPILVIRLLLAVTKTVSVEFEQKKDPIVCILLHPGIVDTDLSRPFQRNVPEGKLFTKEYSVQKLLNIINNAKSHDNDKFFAWDGQEIPW
ncbi:hypothetical protein GH714_016622 [Hevea brasiliensis]|uniref:Uncharacterized protein n=1 Tax=Hevea brasiliensis TaxID=3981 RepID=A0A6A6ME04_HEVBR|nr:hypothetical protein GH714_016622 [Hevea brasiliensis]